MTEAKAKPTSDSEVDEAPVPSGTVNFVVQELSGRSEKETGRVGRVGRQE